MNISANTAVPIRVFFNCAHCGHSERSHPHGATSFCNVVIYGHGLCPCAGFVTPPDGALFTSDERPVSDRFRSFFVDVHFDESGHFIGLQVQEHGEVKDATDERGLAQAIRNYFEYKRRTGG